MIPKVEFELPEFQEVKDAIKIYAIINERNLQPRQIFTYYDKEIKKIVILCDNDNFNFPYLVFDYDLFKKYFDKIENIPQPPERKEEKK